MKWWILGGVAVGVYLYFSREDEPEGPPTHPARPQTLDHEAYYDTIRESDDRTFGEWLECRRRVELGMYPEGACGDRPA